jgi:tetratricopeptide (TPR) repeat protein
MTEGQPLFVTRLVQLLVEQHEIEETNGSWSLTRAASDLKFGVPESVRGVLQKKLESLPDGDLRALQYASVAGVEFTSAMAASLLSVDEVALEERLDQLARMHHLLVQRGEERCVDGLTLRYRFAHVLYRDVLYESLASKRRMRLHGQVAERLLVEHGDDARSVATQLAFHCEAARNFEQAIHHLQEAADNAARLHANREAKQHYARALGLVRELPDAERPAAFIILHYNLGWCNFKAGDLADSLRDFEQMLQYASLREFVAEDSAAERARSLVFAYFVRPWRDTFGIYDMPRMPNQDPSMGAVAIQCEAYSAICLLLLQASRLEEMGSRLGEFLRLAESAGNQPRRVEALAWKAMHELRMAELSQAARTLSEATPLARALSHQRALQLCCEAHARVHYLRCEYEAAEAMNAEALTLTFEAAGRVGCLLGVGVSRVPLGRFSAALAALNEAFQIAKQAELDQPSLQVFLCGALGWVFLEAGDSERALTQLEEGVELAKTHGLTSAQGRCSINLARAHLARGQLAEAESALTRAETFLEKSNAKPSASEDRRRSRERLYLLAAQAEHLLALGKFELGRRRGKALLELATELALPEHVAYARHLNARAELGLGNSEALIFELQAGLEALGARTLPLIRWKLLALLGAERLRVGDSAAAREAFTSAGQIVDQISTSIDEATLRAKWEASASVRKLREEARRALGPVASAPTGSP